MTQDFTLSSCGLRWTLSCILGEGKTTERWQRASKMSLTVQTKVYRVRKVQYTLEIKKVI